MSSGILRAANKQLLKNNNNKRLIAQSYIRSISTTQVKNAQEQQQQIPKKSFKFTYETSKNVITENQDYNLPENKLSFGQYQRKSTTLKLSEEDSGNIPSLLALHSRLNLSKDYKYSTLVRSLTCKTIEGEYADNQQMSLFGSNLLSFYVTEYLIANYPRLPLSILKNATEAYIGDLSLYDVGKNSWGIEADSTTNLEKFLAKEPKLFKFGKLRFDKHIQQVETGVTKYGSQTSTSLQTATAFASAVRSIIAGVYTHDGEAAAKQFINDNILSRKVNISSMFQFNEPGKLLIKLLKNKKMEPPVIRLISETGRLSNSPVFIVGCFSGDQMLSEGQGSSLKEARIRSSVNALKAFYLYKPLDAKPSSDVNFQPMFVDEGESFY